MAHDIFGSSPASHLNAITSSQRLRSIVPQCGQCTHLTVTRLYTKEFRCSLCGKAPPSGWLFRCTQDRELMIENDMERGFAVQFKMDAICDLFPATSMRPRRPAARAWQLPFFNGIGDDGIKNYTSDQIQRILMQRAVVLETVQQDANLNLDANNGYPTFTSSGYHSPYTSSHPKPETTKHSWSLPNGAECQFKCCPGCRPSIVERSYLSLNGIVDGDIPATAITGFGFNLQHHRPVALVKHVKNLGLRPNPPAAPATRVFQRGLQRKLKGMGIVIHKDNDTDGESPRPRRKTPSPREEFIAWMEGTQYTGRHTPTIDLPTDEDFDAWAKRNDLTLPNTDSTDLAVVGNTLIGVPQVGIIAAGLLVDGHTSVTLSSDPSCAVEQSSNDNFNAWIGENGVPSAVGLPTDDDLDAWAKENGISNIDIVDADLFSTFSYPELTPPSAPPSTPTRTSSANVSFLPPSPILPRAPPTTTIDPSHIPADFYRTSLPAIPLKAAFGTLVSPIHDAHHGSPLLRVTTAIDPTLSLASHPFVLDATDSDMKALELAVQTLLPPQSLAELIDIYYGGDRETEEEGNEQVLRNEPLEVKDGVTITEAAVELHELDLITQF